MDQNKKVFLLYAFYGKKDASRLENISVMTDTPENRQDYLETELGISTEDNYSQEEFINGEVDTITIEDWNDWDSPTFYMLIVKSIDAYKGELKSEYLKKLEKLEKAT